MSPSSSACALAALVLALSIPPPLGAAVNVSINPDVRQQVVLGYGCASWMPMQATPTLRAELIEELVTEFGINRLRLEIPGGNSPSRRRWEWFNDDGNPTNFQWSAYNLAAFDEQASNVVAVFRRKVEARGEPFDLYISPSFFDGGSTGSAPTWLLQSPGEYAEFAMSLLLRLRDVHGIEAPYYCILNEAGNNNGFTSSVVQKMIRALGPRMEAAGFRTRVEYPECVSVDAAWNYINGTKNDAEMWSHVGLVSYHLYGTTNQFPNVRAAAWSRGLPTGQTEYMSLTTTVMVNDFTQGGASVWEVYGIAQVLDVTGANYDRLVRNTWYWPFRQLTHYVRPGARRVAATSGDSQLGVLAFERAGRSVVVLFNDRDAVARTADLSGLIPGLYGACQTVNRAAYVELGTRTVSAGGTLSVAIPGGTVFTLYPHPGTNQPPSVTLWQTSNAYLKQPASSTTLQSAAQDPELDALTYRWSVTQAPPGAVPVLATPGAASCAVSALTAVGTYAFRLDVRDATHTVTREARITVFSGNQPPLPFDVHNRNPVLVTAPQTNTLLRSAGWDLEGATLSYRWELESQPGGAPVQLVTPLASACVANGLTVPGDYVFRVEVGDGVSTSSASLTVPVYPIDAAPVISNAVATPPAITLPASSTTLTAATSDPDGNVISHWWSVKTAPAGAAPVFAAQGSRTTLVKGLIVPGNYTFTLTVVDRNTVATKDVSLTVAAGASPAAFCVTTPNGGETYTGGQAVSIRWTSFNGPASVRIDGFDGSTWSPIATNRPNNGVCPWALPNMTRTGCRVRVSDAADGNPTDESDATFTVTASSRQPDGDMDGIADAWERVHFASLTNAAAGTDADDDRSPDAAEFGAGTDPRDSASRLEIRSARQAAPSHVILSWTSTPGRTYEVLRARGLRPPDWMPTNTPVAATPPLNVVTLRQDAAATSFYRVRIP